MAGETAPDRLWLRHSANAQHDHIRGDPAAADAVSGVLYGDYLCPFCRRLRPVMRQLRDTLGERLVYVYGHFRHEKAHRGATFFALASQGAVRLGWCWDVHYWRLYKR